MACRRFAESLVFCLLLVTAGCHNPSSQPSKTPLEAINHSPGAPSVELAVSMRSQQEAYVAVTFLEKSTDAENDKVAYTFAWFRNGEPMTFPTTQTDTVSKLGPDVNPDPFATDVSETVWKVIVTPRDPYGVGASVETSATVSLSRACEPLQPGYIFVDCMGEFVFSTPLTEPVSTAPSGRVVALNNVIAQHILGADGTSGHSRFRNFTDLLLKSAFMSSTRVTVPYDPDTYEYSGGPAALVVPHLLDRTCIDVPLVGAVCLNGYLYDIDNETGSQMMDFGPVAASRTASSHLSVTQATPSENGTVFIKNIGGDEYEVIIKLRSSLIDLFFEPPADPMLDDISNNSENYLPEMDLSTYLKAYGHAALGDGAFNLTFHVTVPGTFDHLDLKLRTIHMEDHDFQFVFLHGPYCNNNLATTELFNPDTGLKTDPSKRPFRDDGTANYPDLISDDTTVDYYARGIWPYPHIASSANGGSGAGRDRLGVNSTAYAFDVTQGMFSDNPNNCVRPADACTIAGVQDGSPDFIGLLASCEGINRSNNSDDATYKISEQITAIIPYIQGEIKVRANRLGQGGEN